MSRRITPGSSLDQLRHDAKRWLKALRANTPAAHDRFRAALPAFRGTPGLRDVQHALARELGFSGWTSLKESVEKRTTAVDPLDALVSRFLDNACPDHHVRSGSDHLRAASTAMRLLDEHPEIATASLATRIVCGDVDGVRTIITADPEAINRRDGEDASTRSGAGNTNDLLYSDLGEKGWTPLLYLAFTRLPRALSNDNAVAMARLLLDAGADPTAYFMAGDSRYTPLVGVIGEGEENRRAHPHRDELVSLLLAGGAEPFDRQVVYNIHFQAKVLWFLERIYQRSRELGREDAWRDPSWSMLDMGGYGNGARWHLAMAIEHMDVTLAEWCLAHGADPDAPPARAKFLSQTSLHEDAVRRGQHEIAALLVKYGAAVKEIRLTPAEQLAAAALQRDRTTAERLIAAYPELRADSTALFRLVRRGHVDAVTLLLDAGVSVDVKAPSNETALHQAVYSGSIAIAEVLLSRGVTVDVVGRNFNNTPLGAAVWARNQPMIALLAPHSEDIGELVYGGAVAPVRDLLAAKPELARSAGDKQTLLMWLTPGDERVAIATAQLLLAHGADPAVRNADGKSAADRADRLGMRTLAALLRHAEAQGDDGGRPTVATYDAMAERLLDAYLTGTPEAMERHYADTWHRRAWSGMRSHVLADLGIHRAADAPVPDITLDDARRWVAYDHQFRSWDELVNYVNTLPPAQHSVTRTPVGASRDAGDDDDRVIARDWDMVIAAIESRGYSTVHAHGQMTDDVLARIAAIPHVTALHLAGSKQLTDAGAMVLARMPQLRHLDIGGTQVTDRGLAAIAGLPQLEHLGADSLAIADACGVHLAACPRLASVSLLWTKTGDGVIEAFAGHPSLRHLTTGIAMTDAGLPRLADIPRYRHWTPDNLTPATYGERGPASLSVRGSFTDRGLAELTALDGLYSLEYESPSATTRGLTSLASLSHLGALSGDFHDADLVVIGAFPVLRRLSCQDTDATDVGWVGLSASRTIERIWGRRCDGLGDPGFRALSTMPALRDLAVSCKHVSDNALALLPTFPALRELMPMGVPDAGFRHIGRCEQLEKLTLMYCRETGDEATAHIVGLEKLQRYFASYTRITDRTPELLATMAGLEEVEFSAVAGLSNEGIAALARSASLRKLVVSGSPQVTPAVKEAFPAKTKVRVE